MLAYHNESLYKALKELDVINPTLLEDIYKQSEESKTPLSKLVLDKNLVSEENLSKLTADLLSLPFIKLSDQVIQDAVLRLIPEIVAKKQKIIAFKKDSSGLHVAICEESDLQVIDLIKKKTGLNLVIYVTTLENINNSLVLYARDVQKAFEDLIRENVDGASKSAVNIDLPVIKIVDMILTYAHQNHASDVHVEPKEEESLVRFRIDGILHDIVSLPKKVHDQVVTRVKVLSKLRTDEHLQPQDGKITFDFEKSEIDIRVSIVPVLDGEKIVMRLLSSSSRQLSLTDLGLNDKDLAKVKKAYQRSYGMVLATGPTGSGKTTTMYAILKLLNNRDVNIMTIEDPVEYDIEGINQIQVNAKTNLTFASGLRSILRQDPNVILVGEIRDQETAGIAINSAMTGHLVLSTLHTTDAATSIPRLTEMGVEPFLISSTLTAIVAQRLVRKIHTACRVSEEVKLEELTRLLEKEVVEKSFGLLTKIKTIRIYKGKGCEICHDTGFEGRIGIFEVMVLDEGLKEAINKKMDAQSISKIAVQSGMIPMLEDGLEKVKQGVTTLEEVLRVTKE